MVKEGMMKKILILIVAITLLLGTVTSVLAADITAATLYGAIRATNSDVLAENVSANVSINSSSWISNGTINATADNVAILNNTGADTAFMPGWGSNPWIVWYSSVSANSSVDATLYTNASDGKIRYFPASGGMTVTDNETMELGDTFTLSASGWIDTDNGINKNIINKQNAFRTYVSSTVSGNITSDIFTLGTDAIQEQQTSVPVNSPYYGTNWRGQTFQLSSDTVITQIELWLRGVGSPTGDVTVSLREVSGGLPIGADLISASVDSSTISGTPGWVSFNVTASYYLLEANTSFAMVFRYPNGDGSNNIPIYHSTANPYANGQEVSSSDSGSSWTAVPANDWGFRVSGNPVSYSRVSATGVASGEHTVEVGSQPSGNTTLIPNGNGYTNENTAIVGASTAWQAIDDFPSDNDTTYISNSDIADTNWYYDFFTTENLTFPLSSANITSVEIYARHREPTGEYYYIRGYARLNATNLQAFTSEGVNISWLTSSGILTTRPGGGNWTATDVQNMEIGFGMRKNAGGNNPSRVTQVYAVINYQDVFTISIDGVTNGSDNSTTSVPDNANNWTFFENGSMPYVQSANISVNGTLAGSWNWEYAATFPDDSVNNNTATPTFRTASSNDNVTASLITFTPVQLAQSTGNTSQTWPSLMTTPPAQPATMFTENATPGFWFAPFVQEVWSLSGLPNSFFWYNFAFLIILSVSILVYALFAEKQTEALFIKIFATAGIMIFFALPGINIYGLYVALYYCLFASGILMLKKDFGW